MTGAETEDDIPLGERKTVTDFCYLLDKSKQLFNGLRSVFFYLLCCLLSAGLHFVIIYYINKESSRTGLDSLFLGGVFISDDCAAHDVHPVPIPI